MKELVICSTIAVISSIFIYVDTDGTTVVVGIAVAVDGGGTARVPCKTYCAALWTSPKS